MDDMVKYNAKNFGRANWRPNGVQEKKGSTRVNKEEPAMQKSDVEALSSEIDLYFTDVDSWDKNFLDCAAQLKKDYPGFYFSMESFSDDTMVNIWKNNLSNGVHMAISPDFLHDMASSPDAFAEGKKIIDNLVKEMHKMAKKVAANNKTIVGMGISVKEDRQASVWVTAAPPQVPDFSKQDESDLFSVRHYQENNGFNVTEIKTKDGDLFRFIYKKKVAYSSGSDVARLARFKKIGNVRSFIGGLQSYMNQISRDPYLDKIEVQQAIVKIKGVLQRASRKVQDLKLEESLEFVRRRAIEAKKEAKADKIADELRRRRTERKSREHIGANDGDILNKIFEEIRYENSGKELDSSNLSVPGSVPVVATDVVVSNNPVISASIPVDGAVTISVDIQV